MRSVDIERLAANLSESVRLASSGETILITDRDRVIAELVPAAGSREERVGSALLADAVRRGCVTPAALPPGPPPALAGVAPLAELVAELAGDRSDR